MALPTSHIRYTPDEYLALEREAEERHEYLDGYIYAMAGESLEHSQICVNLAREVSLALKGKTCQAFSPNMKVRTSPSGLYCYPDLTVVCGEPVFHDSRRDLLTNPTAIIEVLSPSTEARDRGEKFFRYQQITSLTDYLLLSQNKPCLEHFIRQPGRDWLYSVEAELSGTVYIASIDCRLALAEVYDRVAFPSESEPTSEPSPRE